MSVISTIVSHLPMSAKEVEWLTRTASKRYKVHTIQKRNNRGERLIAQPTLEVKALQRVIVSAYIDELPVHWAAKAYRKGSGIYHHAAPHASNRYLLKLDFKDFFPSMRGRDLVKHLRKYSSLDESDIKLIVRILFWKPKGINDFVLSIGAPSSPAVSNTLMYDFDEGLSRYCREHGMVYTRYADDLAISTNQQGVLGAARDYVIQLCSTLKYPRRLQLNEEKTVHTSMKHNRRLTGLVLSNEGSPSLGRERKRLIRSMVHRYSDNTLEPDQIANLRGWLAFAKSIDKSIFDDALRKLGDERFCSLMGGVIK